MRSCKKCLLPETYETIEYNHSQVCNICVSIGKKDQIDWKKRFLEFEKIINKFKNKGDYDCIIPFSGGKDSTYQLYYIIEKLNLKPLVIRFNHGFYRPVTIENTSNVLKKLYDAWGEKSMYGKKFMGIKRTTVFINKKGIIQKIWNNVKVKDHVTKVVYIIQELVKINKFY